jgi:ribose/xylose/arabinose/galactoside ABC-type transport system permease subunit
MKWDVPRITSLATLIRVAALLALAVLVAVTPGFFSAPSLLSLLTTVSFVGCVAAGMTLISLSGNIMSLALGATTTAAALLFAKAVNVAGFGFGIVAALLLGGCVTAIQGFAIGWARANPIIVSIAALSLIGGVSLWTTAGAEIYIANDTTHAFFRSTVLGVPMEFIILLAITVLGQFIVSYTAFGRHILMIGGNWHTAHAAGIRTWRTITGVYFWAGLFAAIPGVLLTSRYNYGSIEYAAGYDYDAIAAVLVGGTSILGGHGSLLRTLLGVLFIGVVQSLVLLHGLREEWQIFITGLVVLAVILLQKAEH